MIQSGQTVPIPAKKRILGNMRQEPENISAVMNVGGMEKRMLGPPIIVSFQIKLFPPSICNLLEEGCDILTVLSCYKKNSVIKHFNVVSLSQEGSPQLQLDT